MQSSHSHNSEYRRKRHRLSRACDQCRTRKVRCDEGQPSCRRCTAAKIECTTSDSQGRAVGPETRRKTQGTRGHSLDGSRVESSAASPASQPILQGQEQGAGDSPESTQANMSNQPSASVNGIDDGPVSPSGGDDGSHAFAVDTAMAVNTDTATIRQQYLGPSSLQVMTQWLDLTFAAYGASQSFSSGFRHGMQHAVEISLPMSPTIPALPPPLEMARLIGTYFEKTNVVLPVFEQQDFMTKTAPFLDSQGSLELDASYRPQLASLYAVLSIGADEAANAITETGTMFLEAAYSLFAHIVAVPYMSSVQALLVITIALMGRNKEGTGFQTLGQAIRIAHSVGLHRRHFRADHVGAFNSEQSSRVFWIAYCLDKRMAFETGRPGMIADEEVDQAPPVALHNDFNMLQAMVGLARIQGQISARLYRGPSSRHSSNRYFAVSAEIDRNLLRWLGTLPEDVRPAGDAIFCPPELVTLASYLAFNYYQVVITLYRPSLLFDNQFYCRQLEAAQLRDTGYHRLRTGESTCVSSARSMIALLNNAIQHNSFSRLFTLTPPLLAVYSLAINIIKHPWSWSCPSDLKLIESTTKQLQQLYYKAGHQPAFYAMLRDLSDMANKIVKHADLRQDPETQGDSNEHTNTRPRVFSRMSPFTNSGWADIADSRPVAHLEDELNTATLELSADDLDVGNEFSNFFSQEFSHQARTEDVSNLFGLPFVGDTFSFNSTMLQ